MLLTCATALCHSLKFARLVSISSVSGSSGGAAVTAAGSVAAGAGVTGPAAVTAAAVAVGAKLGQRSGMNTLL